jgi:O-antigen/teichoic acid export membrane protein
MPKARQIVRGIFSNWMALAVSAVISFVISPFVVTKLGALGYGVWTLVNSTVAYIGLMDLGLRGAVTRYISRDYVVGDHAGSERTLRAALWFRILIGAAAMTISLVLSVFSSKIFRVPIDMQLAMRVAIVLCGTSVAVSLFSGVFAAVLASLHRFDLISMVTICHVIIRASGVILLLRAGHGIMALAWWELCVTVGSGLALLLLTHSTYPELRFSLKVPERDTIHRLWSYSWFLFIINITVQVIYYTDNLVIGAFVSATGVAFYAIGGGIVEILRNINSALTATFAPLASSLDAANDRNGLYQLLLQGTRCSLLVSLPIAAGLYFRGSTFIGLWMGKQYAGPSGHIIRILLLAQIFAIANATAGNIAYGLEKHRRVVPWACLEAILNLALSIFLVHRMGINGVAWGTVIASWIIHFLFWPRYTAEMLSVSLPSYLAQSWLKPALATVPFAVACYYAERLVVPKNLLHFFLEMATIMPIFVLGVLIVFRGEAVSLLRKYFWFSKNRQPLTTERVEELAVKQ